ncbi:hypothetical protein KJ940_19455, partial [Myxococcota bacterium]|nr:hypothetical protein [Myxococcota bacterium]
PACAARLETGRASAAAFLRARPPSAFLAALEARRVQAEAVTEAVTEAGPRALEAPTPPRRRRARLTMGLLALAALILLAWPPRPPPPAPTTRIKAAVDLSFHVKRGAQIHLGRDGEALSEGDQIQLRVSTPRPAHLVVISLDGAGAVTPFYDDDGHGLALGAGVAQLLEGSVVLDEALGAERILGCFSSAPLETAQVIQAAQAALAAVGRDPRRVERLDLPCDQASFLIDKVQR